MDKGDKLGALSSLMASYAGDEGDSEDEEVAEDEGEVPSRQLASEILESVVTTALEGKRPADAFTAVQEPSSSEGSDTDDDDDSGNEDADESESETSSEEEAEAISSDDNKKEEKDKEEVERVKVHKKSAYPESETANLPRIEDLHITVPEAECVEMGEVHAVVDDQVVVKSLANTAAIDLESVLFLEKGSRTLGRVFDVFGPVSRPFYAVRFNSAKDIADSGVTKGQKVFMAPRTEHTAFVFLGQLLKLKGTDASWKGDDEVPGKFQEFSDDEEERRMKRAEKAKRKAASSTSDGEVVAAESDDSRQEVKSRRGHWHQNNARRTSDDGNAFFYRQQRRFDPRAYGPIRWNSQHTGLPQSQGPHGHPPPSGHFMRPPMFGTPPPPRPANGALPNPFVHPSQQQMSVPPPPPPHVRPPPNYHWSQVFNQPPPPPPT